MNKMMITLIALATLIASPALAQSARHPQGGGPQTPIHGGSDGVTGPYGEVIGPGGRIVGQDPDPQVREMIRRDPYEWDSESHH
jgi:hypothetical protein